MSNYLDAAIATALGAGDRFLNIFGLDKDYLTGGYDQLRSFLGPHVQYPLGLIGLDVDYLVWLLCVLAPIIFAFVLPLITVTVFYLCICVINFVKFKHHFYQIGHSGNWRKAGRLACAIMWRTLGRLWHGYEVRGLDKLPINAESPAMLVYYHGEMPIDCYYLMAELVLQNNDKTKSVADRFVFQLPGWGAMLEAFNVIRGTRSECEEAFSQGYFVLLAPGGTREMLYSDANYDIHWGSRLGYAKLALKAKVPIYPVFTRNIREVFRFVRIRPFWNWQLKLYERFKLPFVLLYGGFPSKLVTFIGDPIMVESEENMAVEDLNERVQSALKNIIDNVQPKPGKIIRAFLERFHPVQVSL